MFFHKGIVSRDSEDESAFMALNISITTKIDKDIVEAVLVVMDDGEKTEQSSVRKVGLSVEHRWKLRS